MKKIIVSCMCAAMLVCGSTNTNYCYDGQDENAVVLEGITTETAVKATDYYEQSYEFQDSNGKKGTFIISNGNVLQWTSSEDEDLEDVYIPNGIKELGSQSVQAITAKTVYIPKSVTDIWHGLGRNSTQEFVVDSNSLNFCSKDGSVYSKDMRFLFGYPNGKEDKIFKIPDRVEKIYCDWGLAFPENLEYIIFPKSLEELEFFYCSRQFKAFYITEYNSGTEEGLEKIIGTNEGWGSQTPLQSPRIVYLPENTEIDFTVDTGKWLPIIGDDYKLSHALLALKTSLGIYDTQLDLREYYEGKEDVLLFDENRNGKVDLSDATGVLKKSLGIVSDTDKSDEEVSTPTPAPDMELTPAPKETNSPIVFPELSLTPPTTSPEVTPAPRPELIDTTNPEDVEYDEEVVKTIDFVEVYKTVLPTYEAHTFGTYVLDANGLLFTTIDEKKEIMEYMRNGSDKDVEIASSWDEIKAQQIAGYKCEGFDYPGWTIDGYWYSIDVKSVSKDEIVLRFDRTAGAYNGRGKELVLNKVDGKWTVVREEEVWIS